MIGYIGIGSNLGDRGAHLAGGLERFAAAAIGTLALSSIWETEPVDVDGGGWFWNMVAKVEADRGPRLLLRSLQAIEREAGRVRTASNGPRTLDLDLLLYGSLEWCDDELCLPHPRMWQRRFVLEPLAEIEPELRHPQTGRTVVEERDLLPRRPLARRLGPLATRGSLPLAAR